MPTLKQIALAERVVANRGRKPMKELMVEAGYSARSAGSHQGQTTRGVGFTEILNKAGITDKVIANKLKDGLAAKDGKRKDLRIRHIYIETIMKSKGLLKEANGDTLGSFVQLAEKLKTFNIDFLISIKQRINPSEPINVTPRDS